jgi:hypothetical protein
VSAPQRDLWTPFDGIQKFERDQALLEETQRVFRDLGAQMIASTEARRRVPIGGTSP